MRAFVIKFTSNKTVRVNASKMMVNDNAVVLYGSDGAVAVVPTATVYSVIEENALASDDAAATSGIA